MTLLQERKLFSRGCLTVFIAMTVTAILAYFVDWKFGVAAIGLLLAGLALNIISNKRENRRIESLLSSSFEDFPGARPNLKQTSSYGYPFFNIQFGTKDEMILAFESGRIYTFRKAIARLYDRDGFDIEKGFDETYVGWEDDYKAAMTDDPNNNPLFREKLRLRDLHYPKGTRQKEAEPGADGDVEEAV